MQTEPTFDQPAEQRTASRTSDYKAEACSEPSPDPLHADILEVVQKNTGLVDPLASLLADALVRGLRNRWGGRAVYIPAPSTRERDEAVRAAFNGRNKAEVMRRFNIGRTTFYNIISGGRGR